MSNFSQMTQLDRIEKYTLLAAKNVLVLEEAALILGVATSTLYKMTMRNQVPYYKPNGKLIYFNKQELEEWMQQNRVATAEETDARASDYNLRKS